jgi:CHAT domain-containing protein/tetratricopeptide (TPR) repeat protein
MKIVIRFIALFFITSSLNSAVAQQTLPDSIRSKLKVADSLLYPAREHVYAIKIFEELEEFAFNNKFWELYFEAKSKRAVCIRREDVSKTQYAKELSEDVIKLADSLGLQTSSKLSEAYYNIAEFARYNGRFEEQITILKDAEHLLTSKRENLFIPDFINLYYPLGATLGYLARNTEAFSYYDATYRSDSTKSNWARFMPVLIRNAAIAQRFEYAHGKAEEFETYAKNIAGDSSALYASALYNKAFVYFQEGNYRKVASINERAFNIFLRIEGKYSWNSLACLSDMGTAYLWLGDTEKSIQILEKAQREGVTLFGEESFFNVNILNNLAVCYRISNQTDHAIQIQLDVLAKAQKLDFIDNHRLAEIHDTMGLIYLDAELPNEAEVYFKEALQLFESSLGIENFQYLQTFNNLSRVNQMRGESEAAADKATEVREKLKEINGENYRLLLPFYNPLAYALYQQEKVEESLGVFAEDNAFYLRFIKNYFQHLGEKSRQQFYQTFSNYLYSYRSFVAREAAEHPELLEDFISFQEQTKGILLNTSVSIKTQLENSGNEGSMELFRKITHMQQDIGRFAQLSSKRLEALQINIDSLEDVLTKMEAQLAGQSEVYSSENNSTNWKEIANSLDENEALVDLVRIPVYDFQLMKPTDSIQYAALILIKDKESPGFVLLHNGNQIEHIIQTYYRNAMAFKFLDQESFDATWQPIEDALKQYGRINKVYVSADGIYHKVNINTLFDTASKTYVAERYQVKNISSLRDITDKEVSNLKNQNFVLLGNPEFGMELDQTHTTDPSDVLVKNLPGTKEEIEKIKSVIEAVPGNEVKTFTEKQAQESNIKKIKSPRVLHIATHGFFSPPTENTLGKMNPLFNSGLLLTGANYTLFNQENNQDLLLEGIEDGILTAYETQALDVSSTELVVLSACETGLGEIQEGEGVYGLQRSFKKAGAQNIIMSLWKVDDNVTQELMVAFYTNWMAGGTIENSFVAAQQHIRKKYNHPYFWGAFVLI